MRGESEFYPVPRAFPLLSSAGFAYCLKQLIHSVPQAFMLRFLQLGSAFKSPGRLLCLLQFFQIRDHIGDF